MSAISTPGARIDRWDNGRRAHREQARLIEALKLKRSSLYLCWEAFITFISKSHDEVPHLIFAPYRGRSDQRDRTRLRWCAICIGYGACERAAPRDPGAPSEDHTRPRCRRSS